MSDIIDHCTRVSVQRGDTWYSDDTLQSCYKEWKPVCRGGACIHVVVELSRVPWW